MKKDFSNLPRNTQSICGHPLAEIVTDREGTSYCAQCEREAQPKPQPKTQPWSLRLNVITIAATGILCLVCFAGGMLTFLRPDDSRQTAVMSADNMTITQIGTNTAAPSATPEDTHTPYPTFTHTGDPEQVEYERVVVHVTERVITTTPQPTYTPFPTWTPVVSTPNAVATQAAFTQRNQNRQDTAFTIALYALTIAVSIFMIGLSLVITGRMIFVPMIEWLRNMLARPTLADTTQTAEEIVTPHDTNDMLYLLDVSDELYPETPKRLAGWRDMPGWNDAERWTAVIEDMQAAGINIVRLQSKGTFIERISRRTARAIITTTSPSGLY